MRLGMVLATALMMSIAGGTIQGSLHDLFKTAR
jgi:hypothetical protein